MSKARALFPRRQNMNSIMATSTERLSVIDFITKHRIISPRFRVMDYCRSEGQLLVAALTSKLIPSQAFISPLYIQNIVSPFLILRQILFSSTSLSGALGRTSRLVRTISRAILSILIILIAPVRFSASFAILKKACLSHQYEIIMEVAA